MAYQIILADTAKADADQIYDWLFERAPVRGPEWFEELMDCIYSLEFMPNRCPLAREAAREAARGAIESKRQIRYLHFGKRRNVYRILYEIDESRKTVYLLHISHGALRDFDPAQFSSPS